MNPVLGVLFHWLGGLASGSFYVPYKRVRNWSWETYWLVGGFASWLFAPWIFALVLTPDPIGVLSQISEMKGEVLPAVLGTDGKALYEQATVASGMKTILFTYLCGVCWGIGGLTFGLTMRYLGMSLGMAIALGYCAAFGTLVPPIVDGTFVANVWSPDHGKVVLLGILICLGGIAIAGWAGTEKEKGMSDEEKKKAIKEFNLPKGLMIATFSGIMSSFFAFGFATGAPINHLSVLNGTAHHWHGLTTLIVILAGGLTTNFIWCIILNLKNKTGYEYFAKYQKIPTHPKDSSALETPTDAPAAEMAEHSGIHPTANGRKIPVINNYFFSLMAGTVWYLQFFFYQIGESKMGDFKFSSWTLHMASIIIFSSLWGLALGEWKGSNSKARKLLFIGLATLIGSTVIVGIGNWMGASGGGH